MADLKKSQARREMDCPIPISSRKIMLVAPVARAPPTAFMSDKDLSRDSSYLKEARWVIAQLGKEVLTTSTYLLIS
jgi:hypothetical protein